MIKEERIGLEKYNRQGCLMKIIEYVNHKHIVVEFQDRYKCNKVATMNEFNSGQIKNPYQPTVCGVGIIGEKYKSKINGKIQKEYQVWYSMLRRCFNEKEKEKFPTYKDVIVCNEWLNYENFYEWVHFQENFDKWLNGDRWAIDKDILIKGNKTYSPETCCLVPDCVNSLFIKVNSKRGDLPIGVSYRKNENLYRADCSDLYNLNKRITIGYYHDPINAFNAYKKEKEKHIKYIAQEEFNKGNITKKCYDAMMNYQVEITD